MNALQNKNTLSVDNLIIGYSKEYKSKIKIDIELKIKNNVKSWEDLSTLNNVIELSMSASVGNSMGGQCLDSIKELALKNDIEYKNNMTKNKLIELIDIWQKYHLNDLQAMSKRQFELFKKHGNDELFLNMCKVEEARKKATCSYSSFDYHDKINLFFSIYDMQNMEKRKELEARKKELKTIIDLYPHEATKGYQEEHTTDCKIDLTFLNIEFKPIVINNYGHRAMSTTRYYNHKQFGCKRKYIYKYERQNITKEIRSIDNKLNNDVNLYKYGTSWLFKIIPNEIINELHAIVETLSNDVNLINEVINDDFTSKLKHDIVNKGLTKNKLWGNQSCIEYEITLKYKENQYTFSFYTGIAHAHPTINDILECLQSDCSMLYNYDNLDDYASDMGIEKPSEAVTSWDAINNQYNELKNLFNDDFDMFLNSDIS